MIHILNQHDPGTALLYTIHSHRLHVEKFLFDASYETKYTINNRNAIIADKKRKLKLKISNA